jgi:hypothetical protein
MNRKMGKLGFGMTVIALVVCLVIVTGSTFSLFTTKDKDDITVNAANVELIAKIDEASLAFYSKGVAQTGKFENGGTATFTNDNHTLTFDNIAPGDKATFNIIVTNNSTIDIQYRIKWTYEGVLGSELVATVGTTALASGEPSEWAKWTPNEDNTKTLKLAFELPITAGDEWQGESASISFYIEAVQANGTGEYSPKGIRKYCCRPSGSC